MSFKCLFFSLLLSYNLSAQINEVDSTLIKNPRQAFLFSLVPGGGQFYNQKYIKGSLVMGLETLALYSWLENSKIYKNYDSEEYSFRQDRYLEKQNNIQKSKKSILTNEDKDWIKSTKILLNLSETQFYKINSLFKGYRLKNSSKKFEKNIFEKPKSKKERNQLFKKICEKLSA